MIAVAVIASACSGDDVQDAQAPVWSMRAPMLEPRSEVAVAALRGKVYVIGGYPMGRVPSNIVQVYDPETDSWELGPPLPVPMHHTMAAVANDRLFIIGGEFDGAGTGRPEIYLSTVYELDEAAGSWTSRVPMPTARSGGGAAVIDGKIYVAGGRPPRGADFAVYDPAADEWSGLPNLPTARNHLGVEAIGGKVYVAGGRFGAGVGSEMTAVLEVYDPATGAWTPAAPLPAPRAGVTAIAAAGCLYIIGGEGNDADPRGIFAENEAYDPATDTWSVLTPMPTPTHGLTGAALINGQIYIPGGATTRGGNTGSVHNQVYQPERTCGG
jgi:N-acetylneuraminic acid mutarotase